METVGAEAIVALVTVGSHDEGERIASALVEEHLAACVNILPGVSSIYRWQGEVQRDQEWLLLVKSRCDALEALVQRVKALHSYEVPEIIALPVIGGSEAYLRWVDEQVIPRTPALHRSALHTTAVSQRERGKLEDA